MSFRRYKVDPAKASEISEIAKNEFGPIISAMPGFVSYFIFDSGDGVVGSISVFEDKASVDASNAKAAQWVRSGLASFDLSPVEITEGEVRAKI